MFILPPHQMCITSEGDIIAVIAMVSFAIIMIVLLVVLLIEMRNKK